MKTLPLTCLAALTTVSATTSPCPSAIEIIMAAIEMLSNRDVMINILGWILCTLYISIFSVVMIGYPIFGMKKGDFIYKITALTLTFPYLLIILMFGFNLWSFKVFQFTLSVSACFGFPIMIISLPGNEDNLVESNHQNILDPMEFFKD